MPPNFNPEPMDSIKLFGQKHVVQPHPRVPTMSYSQEAGRAMVHQLRDEGGEYLALKVFKKRYRDATLIEATENLEHIADFEGLRAARRRIVLPSDPAARRHRNLEYAMLMPWVHGETWYDVLGKAQTDGLCLEEPVALRLCNRFLEVMEGLETAGMAHTDISPGNVTVEMSTEDVQLLDLEDMYMAGATPPSQQNLGSAGYRHRSGDEGETYWRPEGDRYAAAVLAAEMLVLVHPNLASKVTQEGFYREHCGTSEGMVRFEEAQAWLEKIAPEFAALFERSWFVESLEECPRLTELRVPIEELANDTTRVPTSVPLPPPPRTSSTAKHIWGHWEQTDSIYSPPSKPTKITHRRPLPSPSSKADNAVRWSQDPQGKKADEANEPSVWKTIFAGVAVFVVVILLIFFLMVAAALGGA